MVLISKQTIAPAQTVQKSVLLIIPCFNESESIGPLLKEIDSLNESYHTVVIDDGSLDNTYEVASHFSPCVKLISNLGIGGAVQTGIRYAKRNGYQFCVQVDGDGQHCPEEVAALLACQKDTNANIVIGSRFLLGDSFRSSAMRRVGIGVITLVIRKLFGIKITDPTSGLRLMDRKAIEFFSGNYPRDFPEPISIAQAIENGLTIVEVPARMRERTTGKSSIGGIVPLKYMIRVVGYLILVRVGRLINGN